MRHLALLFLAKRSSRLERTFSRNTLLDHKRMISQVQGRIKPNQQQTFFSISQQFSQTNPQPEPAQPKPQSTLPTISV